jgi:esterase
MAILHANVVGEGEKDLVVLHGFLGMGDNWKSHARQWSAMGYRVHLLDQRNHGRSFWDPILNYELMAEDLLSYVKETKLEDFVLLGHSMGGKTAMYFSCCYPDYVKQLIVVDIAPKYYPPHHEEILTSLALIHNTELQSREQADQLLQKQIADVGLRQFLLKNLYRITPERLALRLNFDVLETASEAIGAALPATFHFSKPTLFLAGERSNYILPEDHQKIKAQFSNSQITTVPVAGHWLHAENPKAFQQIVQQWLAV